MDKMTFASYKFKPSDVIEGLNRYFAETRANRYRRVPLEIRRGVCYNNPDCVKDIIFTNSFRDWHTKFGRVRGKYYLICDPEEVAGVAINWLREEHDIFYALEEGHAEKSKIIDRQKTMIKDLEKQIAEEAEENRILRGNLDYFADLAQKRQTELSDLRYEILKVYREIFDCSNGDPEGSDEEMLQDILTEYQRVLKLKDVAEEKTINYKELALENEDKARKYKDAAKENRVQWNNTNVQLQWAQKENLEWVKRYETLKSELDRYKWLYGNLKDGMASVLQEAEERED
jgi:hypothetical protein